MPNIYITFIDCKTNEDIHSTLIDTDVNTIYEIYSKGKFVEIKGTEYQVTEITPCINGTVKFKVKVR